MVHTLHKAVEKLKSLPAGQKEAFASLFVKGTSNLTNRQDKLMASRSAIPTRLPDVIQKPTFLFTRNRKRGLSGAALAERSERDRQRAIKRANCEAEATRREGEEILQQMRDERIDYRVQFLAYVAEVRAQKEAEIEELRGAPRGDSARNAIKIDDSGSETALGDNIILIDDEVLIKQEPGLEDGSGDDDQFQYYRDEDQDQDQQRESSIVSELT